MQQTVGYNGTYRLGIIDTHGDSSSGTWYIGDMTSNLHTFLKKLPAILRHFEPHVKELKTRYDCLILDACNSENVHINRRTCAMLGVPIVYATDLVQGADYPHTPHIVTPKRFS